MRDQGPIFQVFGPAASRPLDDSAAARPQLRGLSRSARCGQRFLSIKYRVV